MSFMDRSSRVSLVGMAAKSMPTWQSSRYRYCNVGMPNISSTFPKTDVPSRLSKVSFGRWVRGSRELV